MSKLIMSFLTGQLLNVINSETDEYRIYSRNSRTFLTKILYLNLGCVIYARKRFYLGLSGYTGNFLNTVLKAWITRANTVKGMTPVLMTANHSCHKGYGIIVELQ